MEMKGQESSTLCISITALLETIFVNILLECASQYNRNQEALLINPLLSEMFNTLTEFYFLTGSYTLFFQDCAILGFLFK